MLPLFSAATFHSKSGDKTKNQRSIALIAYPPPTCSPVGSVTLIAVAQDGSSDAKRLRLELPLFLATVQAGFPSPATDYLDTKLDLNEWLVQHPAATFFVRVSGSSMIGCGIQPGSTLLVDRSIQPSHRQIVVAVLDGEFTVKRLLKKGARVFLAPENPEYEPIEVKAEHNFEVWGVVTCVINQF